MTAAISPTTSLSFPLVWYSAKGFLADQALLYLFFGGHFQEAVEFFVELLADVFFSEQRAKAACYVSQHGHRPLLRGLEDPGDGRDLPAPFSRFRVEPLASLV